MVQAVTNPDPDVKRLLLQRAYKLGVVFCLDQALKALSNDELLNDDIKSACYWLNQAIGPMEDWIELDDRS
jgi:hypothetical protein